MDAMEIELKPDEVVLAHATAKERFDFDTQRGWPDRLGRDELRSHFVGVLGEFSVWKYCGLPLADAPKWLTNAQRRHDGDIPLGPFGIEVRSTTKTTGPLYIKPSDPLLRPIISVYVPIEVLDVPYYKFITTLRGWTTPDLVLQSEWLPPKNGLDYVLNASDLKDMLTLDYAKKS